MSVSMAAARRPMMEQEPQLGEIVEAGRCDWSGAVRDGSWNMMELGWTVNFLGKFPADICSEQYTHLSATGLLYALIYTYALLWA